MYTFSAKKEPELITEVADSRAVAKKAQEELDYLVRESEAVLGVTGRAKGAQHPGWMGSSWPAGSV